MFSLHRFLASFHYDFPQISPKSARITLLSVGGGGNFPAFSSGPGGGRGWDRSLARGRTD